MKGILMNPLFQKINEYLNISNQQNETKTNEKFFELAHQEMNKLGEYIYKNLLKEPEGVDYKVSIGQGNKTSSPLIGIRYSNYSKWFSKKDCLAIAIGFSPKINSVFIGLATSATNYKKNLMFLKQKNEDFFDLIKSKLNFEWENSLINYVGKSIEDRWHMYYCSSVLYKSIDLSQEIEEKYLENCILDLFKIYSSVVQTISLSEYLSTLKFKKQELEIKEYPPINFSKLKVEEFLFEAVEINVSKEITKKITREKNSEKRKRNEINGKRAEEIVRDYEKFYLESQDREDLANKVEIMTTDGDGYDIKSYSLNGKPKFIEVKSSVSPSINNIVLFFTRNEIQKIESIPNISVYYITGTNKKLPRIIEIKKNQLEKFFSKLIPMTYSLKLENLEPSV